MDGVMVSVLASSALDHGFSAKHAALRRKSKDWFARNYNNVSEWSDMSTHGLLFQWARTIKKSNSACWSSTKWISSSSHSKLSCARHDIAEQLMNWRKTTITHSHNNSHYVFKTGFLYKSIINIILNLHLIKLFFSNVLLITIIVN